MISVVFVEYIFLEGIGDTKLKPHSSLGLGRQRTTTQKLFSHPPKTPSHRDPMQKLGTASLIPGYRNKYRKNNCTIQCTYHYQCPCFSVTTTTITYSTSLSTNGMALKLSGCHSESLVFVIKPLFSLACFSMVCK